MKLIVPPNNTIKFSYEIIDAPELIKFVKKHIPLTGELIYLFEEQYCYLKVHDDFIFQLIQFVEIKKNIDNKENLKIKIPEYFPPKMSVGAHISIIYPNELENQNIHIEEVNRPYAFDILQLLKIEMDTKTIYALSVISEELALLRTRYKLPHKLNYRGFQVPFHITIAVCEKLMNDIE